MFNTEEEVRQNFWESYPEFQQVDGWTQNDYCTDIRVTFTDHIDYLHRDKQIDDEMAQEVTL